MGKEPEKPLLVNWLLRQSLTGVHSCTSLLDQAARVCLRKDAIAAASYTAATLNAFWNYVLRVTEEHTARGLSSSFLIHDSETKTFECYPLPRDSSKKPLRRCALRARNRPAVLEMIDSLSDRQYEALSCVLLEALGATEINLTRGGNEGGIDAFGSITYPASSHLLGSLHRPVRVIVQAKMHRRPMPADMMKEFLLTIDEVKFAGQLKTEAIIPAWFRAVRGPIIGLAMSHSGFQSGAESRARSHGVVTADSVDVAEVIALKKKMYGEEGAGKIKACLRRIDELVAESDSD